jgi:hypothetical protein
MKNLKVYAKFLEFFVKFIVLPLIIFVFAYRWFINGYSESLDKFWVGFGYSWDVINSLANLPILSKILYWLIDGFSGVLILFGCFYFIKILKLYQKGEIFSSYQLRLFQKISRIAMAWALYAPVKHTLLTLVSTFLNPVGQRVIEVSITSHDVINIFVVGFLLVITSLMQEAYALKNESDLTV